MGYACLLGENVGATEPVGLAVDIKEANVEIQRLI